jgi:ATP-dependent DNA helicase RecG
MRAAELRKLLARPESETLELKTSFGKEAIETACAFANTKGGNLVIGVDGKGAIKGVETGKEVPKDWMNKISQSTEPSLIPNIETAKMDGKTIAVIKVDEFPMKPVSVKGRCYRRVGSSNRLMPPQEIAQMHMAIVGASLDALLFEGASIEDIDVAKVERYLKKAMASGRKKISNYDSPLKVLEKLELVKNGRPTWAALILFGEDPQYKLVQATVHCGRLKEKTVIIDDRLIGETALEQIDEVMDFIRKNISVRFVMTGKPEREEVWEYPLEAIREAVTNAICHRDYSEGSDIQVMIYDDCLTIWNPGGLPEGMSIAELYNPHHASRPRNRLIAQVFYDVEFIERYGGGIQKIMDACEMARLPQPVFEEKFGGFLVTFNKDIYTKERLEALGLNARQIKAVMYVKEKQRIKNKDYQEINAVSRQTATIELNNLAEKGILIRTGRAGRGIAYELPIMPNK